MQLKATVLFAVIAVALAGCFTSEDPLIAPRDAAFPFSSLTVRGEDGSEVVIRRSGDHYAIGEERVHFLMRGYGDLFLLQLTGPAAEGRQVPLYGVADLDLAGMTMTIYRMAARPTDFDNGIPKCAGAEDDLTIACLTDGEVLVDLVRTGIAAGEEPDMVLQIVTAN